LLLLLLLLTWRQSTTCYEPVFFRATAPLILWLHPLSLLLLLLPMMMMVGFLHLLPCTLLAQWLVLLLLLAQWLLLLLLLL